MQKIIVICVLLFVSISLQANDVEKDTKRWVKMRNEVKDTKLGLIWQDSKSTKTRKKTWTKGKKYCEKLSLSGAYNWRLPTYKELITIVDYTRYEPAVESTFEYTNVMGYYWTSDEVVTNDKYAWYVFFQYGLSYTYSKQKKSYIRCVRSASNNEKAK